MAGLDASAEEDILARFDDNNRAIIINVVNEMRADFLSSAPLLYYHKKLGVAQNQNTWSQSLGDLTKGLYIKMLSRLLMLGYGSTNQVMNMNGNTITEHNMYLWYGEFKALAIDLKSFDPRTINGGSSFFKVANLFTRAGNGDDQLSFKELHENLAILLSAGGPVADDIYAPEARIAYFHSLVNVVRISPTTEGKQVESSDVKGLNEVLYFVEELFALHDTDHNTKISEAEIRAAYPKFKGVATEFAEASGKAQLDQFTSWEGDVAGFGCFSRDDLIRESFIFLGFNGRLPKLGDFNIEPCLLGKPLLNYHGEIDRARIAGVFQSLHSVLVPAPAAQ